MSDDKPVPVERRCDTCAAYAGIDGVADHGTCRPGPVKHPIDGWATVRGDEWCLGWRPK